MSPSLAIGAGASVGLYLVVLISVGYATRRRRAGTGLGDFYLAGRNLGGFVLLLTLYATQYSGNTLLGYPGEAFRIGYAWVMSVGFMMAIIVVYLIYAPRLQRLARRHGFVTPGDWITHRFRSAPLTLIANVLLVLAISNYLLAQLMAMGHVTEGLSGGAVPYWVGVVLLTLVVIVYETVGGMRAVAWTDCIQGIMLLLGLAGLLLAVVPTPTHLTELTMAVAAEAPEKVAVPAWGVSRNWLSTLLLIGFSGAVYPHAIQRIYAARDAATLKRAFSVMVFLPLVTTGVMFHGGHPGHPRAVRHRRRGPGDAGAADRLERAVGAALPPLRDGHHRRRRRGDVDRRLGAPEPVVDPLPRTVVGVILLKDAPEERLTRIGKAALVGGRRRAGAHRAVAAGDAVGPDRDQDGDPRPGRAAVRPRRDVAAPDDGGGLQRNAGGVHHLRRTAARRPAAGVGRPRGWAGCPRAGCQRGRLCRGDAPTGAGRRVAGRAPGGAVTHAPER